MNNKERAKLRKDIGFLTSLMSAKWQKGNREHKDTDDDLSRLSLSEKAYQILEEQIDGIWYTLDLYRAAKDLETNMIINHWADSKACSDLSVHK